MTAPTPYDKLRTFATYPDGWAFGEGRAFSQEVLTQAGWLMDKLDDAGHEFDVFPGHDGQIVVTAYIGTKELIDFTVEVEK